MTVPSKRLKVRLYVLPTTGGSGSSSGAAATATVSAQSSTSASSATSGDTAVVAVEIDEYSVDSQFVIDGSQVSKIWFEDNTPWDERTNNQPKTLTYVKLSQTDGESAEKRFGDFVSAVASLCERQQA